VERIYEQLEGVAMMENTRISSNLEEPFDFGNNKAIGGVYSLGLEDGSSVRIILFSNQEDTPYGQFMFYIDYVWLTFFESTKAGADVPGSGPVVLDRFLAKGTIIVASLKLISVSYEPIQRQP
jgi:hypothetical protein